MNKLLQLHDKVKYHRYRDDIVAAAAHYRRYTSLFTELLDAFQKEIDDAKKVPPSGRNTGMKMLVELENRCFIIDARHKLALLDQLGENYRHSGSYDSERRIRILMAQLEGVLSSIHEYIVSGKIGFILRYPTDDMSEVRRLVWQSTDYI